MSATQTLFLLRSVAALVAGFVGYWVAVGVTLWAGGDRLQAEGWGWITVVVMVLAVVVTPRRRPDPLRDPGDPRDAGNGTPR